MKLLLIVILSFFLIPKSTSLGQEINVENAINVSDPVQNRLFWMSTGNTIPEGKFWGSMYTFFLIQGGYAITDYFHLNLTTNLPIWGSSFLGTGAKFQIYKGDDFVRGVAIGADWFIANKLFSSGYMGENFYGNLSLSLGTDYTKLHFNITQFFQKETEYSRSHSWAQVGFETIISSKDKGGVKFIAEGMVPQTYDERFELSLFLIGVRAYRSNFVSELAFVFTRFSFFRERDKFEIIKFPYIGLTYSF
ncbi:MAG: hypothetical protein Q8K98_00155 [Bacteroidota bacterium]|nr:hypothetical protein [Bacteroidota bacterium]